MHAALLIDFVNAQLHAGTGLLAITCQRARQVLNTANENLVFGHALLGQCGAGQGEAGGSQQQSGQCVSHGRSPESHRYMASICSAYLVCTSLRLSFMVGVSSSSSALSWVSSSQNFLTCSTRANFLLTPSMMS